MDMSLPSGSVTGLIGVNGAGKTTLLRALAGILQPQTGHIIDHEGASIEPLELQLVWGTCLNRSVGVGEPPQGRYCEPMRP